MDAPTDRPRADPRQRWRLVVRRSADAAAVTQRDVSEAWERALGESGLPVAVSEGARPRPRVSFGAPLPTGVAAEAELIDLVLTERLPAWHVREALAAHLPPGWSIVDLYDVWLAGPPLAGQVVAADYRVVVRVGEAGAGEALDPDAVARAAGALLAAPSLPRERARGGGNVAYDLRPLLLDLAVVGAAEDGVTLRARTRFHAELGTGRPEEVVLALGDALGRALATVSIVRERVLLGDELGEPVNPA